MILDDPLCLHHLSLDRLRLDSPGENQQVSAQLIGLGGAPKTAVLEFGEIGYTKEYHLGFCRVLELIESCGIPCLNAPSDIAVMFDKWLCHLRFQARGLARPSSQLAPLQVELFLDWMAQIGDGRIFLKPLHGSSASGVCALQWRGERQQLTAAIEFEPEVETGRPRKLWNSLRIHRYTQPQEIRQILELLLPQGMIVESWIPKLALAQGMVDLRVLIIAGEARHRVVRQSHSPLTNLHLGNQRGSETELIDRITLAKFEEALDLAEEAARCFPQSLYAGVDILIDSLGRSWIGEINAFGDLLPRLEHRHQSAYEAIAQAVLRTAQND
jgi:glutathione synthase/RimK-type ligase-like ATP-grasp enzyme